MSDLIRVLDAATIAALAPAEDAIFWMREAMALVSGGTTVMPLRQVHSYGDAVGDMGFMHGYAGGDLSSVGVKLVGFPPPEQRRGSSHQGLMILYDADGLTPVALLDGGALTAARTAAVTALATDVLARRDASTLAILGRENRPAPTSRRSPACVISASSGSGPAIPARPRRCCESGGRSARLARRRSPRPSSRRSAMRMSSAP